MPPKHDLKSSNALIARGKRDVVQHESSKAKSLGQRPSTSKALILRNAKYGVGSGEIQLYKKTVFGQEKLDILAEDIVNNALRELFDFEKLRRSVESQYEAYASQIEAFRDPAFLYNEMEVEVAARSLGNASANQTADIFGAKVHNIYVLTASWRVSTLILEYLSKLGISNSNIRGAVERDMAVSSLMQNLHEVLQDALVLQISALRTYAVMSSHYSPYFKANKENGTIDFDRSKLKDLYKSYLDSIIVELILPQSRYPIHVLIALLHDCLTEAPREADRITQAMYDVMGDICITVQCLDMVESPLIRLPTLDAKSSPLMERFRNAQALSTEATSIQNALRYRDLVYPLGKLKQKPAVNAIWTKVDMIYKQVTGLTIDELFELDKERVPKGRWSYASATGPPKKIQSTQRKLISDKAPRWDDPFADLPELVSDSASSDMVENFGSDEEADFGSDLAEYDDDSALDTDDEDHMRELLRECMDAASADPEFVEKAAEIPKRYKSNGLLKTLKTLAGRVFSGDPVLTADSKPRNKFFGPEIPPPSAATQTKDPPTGASTVKPKEALSMQPVVEEVADEDAGEAQKKKKKKKAKKKKKKNAATVAEAEGDDNDDEDIDGKEEEAEIVQEALADMSLRTKESPAENSTPTSTPTKQKPMPSGTASQANVFYGMSGHALPSSVSLVSTTAQSARSYLKEEKLLDEKVKPKSRPDPSTTTSPSKKVDVNNNGKDHSKDDDKKASKDVFHRLLDGAKSSTRNCFAKMFGNKKTGSMKWDDFVKSMVDLGFTYEGSTAGSSVRFDPPDPKDNSISVHKPHPKAVLNPNAIKMIAKRLKGRYDWKPELFYEDD